MNGIMNRPTRFGLIVGTRNIFNGNLARNARTELLSVLKGLGIEYVIPPENATRNGAIETVKDAALCAELFRAERDTIDGVVVVLPNFGDELGVVETLLRANLDVPVLVQASDDENDKVDLTSRRDAFCGKLSVCNNLYQNGIKFTDTTRHTCAVTSSEFAEDLKRFAAVCRTVKGLRTLRVGQIGTRPGAFRTVRYSEKLLQMTGISVEPIDLSEIFAAAERIDSKDAEFQEKIDRIRSYGKIVPGIPRELIEKQAKLGLAIDRWMDTNDLDASAVQCWDSILDNYGCAACLSMSMMGESGRPSACETDIAGAVSMYALLLAGGSVPGFLDWNNNFAQDANKCVCTHCSNYPKSFMGNEIEIGNLDVLSTVRDPKSCFGAIKGHVATGKMTFFRISTDDTNGRIKAYVGEGAFTDDPYGMNGGIAVCEIPRMRKLLATLCANGFEHHVAMARGAFASVLNEATGKYLGWTVYDHTGGDPDAAVIL
jgi:L-fucose isomerase-like protein